MTTGLPFLCLSVYLGTETCVFVCVPFLQSVKCNLIPDSLAIASLQDVLPLYVTLHVRFEGESSGADLTCETSLVLSNATHNA